MIVVLDRGHGSSDPGAVGNGLKEADLTGSICIRVVAKLAPYDVQVKLAPRGELEERADFANNLNADYFLSVHVNAGGGTGFESYIYPEAGEETKHLQEIIHNSIMEYLAGQGVPDRGKKQKQLYVLRRTNMPAALLECLFIDRPEDAAKLKDEAFLNGLANAIAWGLVVAFDLKKKIPSDPCADCQVRTENARLKKERDDMRQVLKNIAGMTAPYMVN